MQMRMAALLALASGAAASPASAQGIAADVEVYGTLVPHLELVQTTGATPLTERGAATQVSDAAFTGIDEPARLRLTQGTSHIGFRGSVELAGDALAVVWQVESGVPIDGDPVLNTLASRNSRVGLGGDFGSLFFGIWDNPYKWASLPVINPIAAGFVADYTALIGTPGFNVGALNLSPGYVANATPGPSPVPRSNAAFYRRDSNSIQYWSPTLFGLSLRASYTTNEFSHAERPAAGTTPALAEIHPDVLSGLLSFDAGPLKLRYGVELHRDYFGLALLGGALGGTTTNPSSRDLGQQGVAAYALELAEGVVTRLAGTLDYLSYETDDQVAGDLESYERLAYYALLEQSIGHHHLWAAYGAATAGRCARVGGAPCSTDGLGAQMLALGYAYHFSPNTNVYAAAYRVSNEPAATYAPFPPIDPIPAPGADVSSVGVGILHHFSAFASTKQ